MQEKASPMQRVHFIGIGGVGMNGLAQLAVRSGFIVTGSDRAYDPEAELFRILAKEGIIFFPQDGSGIHPEATAVVYSTAIESDNPDLEQAVKLNIPLLHRAEFLKTLIGNDTLIAVAGTAGKTTTTGLLGWIFECLQHDPSVYNGAALLNWKTTTSLGNIRKGNSGLWIIEADESDKSFLQFHPNHAIITNISRDHFELNELHVLFDQFRQQIAGTIIEGTIRPILNSSKDGFIYEGTEFKTPMLGRHNIENAFCAVRLCHALGFNMGSVRDALSRFNGIERRLETVGTANGVTIIDDYAHNPIKLAAALEAVSERFKRVHAYWRPHGFTPLRLGLDEFAETFVQHWEKKGGTLFILPVYFAGGTVQKQITSADLITRINSAGVPAKAVADYTALKKELERCVQPGDAILGMGARDPQLPLFAQQLVKSWNESKS